MREGGRRWPGGVPRGGFLILGLLLGLLLLPGPGAAQASRPLPPGHWSYDLQEALHALGLPGASLPVFRGTSVAGQRRAIREAGADPSLPDGSLDRLLSRWAPPLAEEGGGRDASLYGEITLGWEEDPSLPVAADEGYLRALVAHPIPWGGTLWGEGVLASGDGGLPLPSAGLSFPLGAFDLFLGRVPISLGQGRDPFVLNGRRGVDGVFLNPRDPFRLPGFLRVLGPVRAHLGLSPFISTPDISSAWWGAAGLVFSPHPRVDLGAIRTVRFAGEGLEGWSFSNVVGMLAARSENNAFDDSQGELLLRVRWDPLGQPLSTYLSMGFEDKATVYEDPGLLAGVLAPFLRGEALYTARYEFQAFGSKARWCQGCPREFHAWYRHPSFGDYVLDGVPLGAMQGGYGASHRARVEAWFSGIPLRSWVEGQRLTRGRRNTLVLRDQAPSRMEAWTLGVEWFLGRDLLPAASARASGVLRSVTLDGENQVVFSGALTIIPGK